jgi:hypothetical protein
MPFNQAFRSVFAGYGGIVSSGLTSQKFYLAVAGLDQPGENLLMMLKVTGWYLLLLGPLAVLDYLLRPLSGHRKYIRPVLFVLGLGLSLWLFQVTSWSDRSRIMPLFMLHLFRALPLFMVILAGALLVTLVRYSGDAAKRNRYCLALVLSAFSLVLLFKIILNTRATHYGFVLAAPATLLLIAALIHWLPRLLAGNSNQGGWVFKTMILAVLIVGLVGYFNATRRRYARKTYQLGKGSDAFLEFPWPEAPALSQTLESIAKMGPDETFVVVPEGVMLNYLSRRISPTKYISFMPAELALLGGEKSMLAALRETPPDYVIVVPKTLRNYGYRAFGVDYCLELAAWMNDNYGNTQILGQTRLNGQRKAAYTIYSVERIDKSPPTVP